MTFDAHVEPAVALGPCHAQQHIAVAYLAVVSYFTGIEYFDMTLSRHGFTWAEKKSIIRKNRMRVFGLGAGTTLCSLIPFTLLFMLPLSAIGGALVYLDLVRAGRIANRDV